MAQLTLERAGRAALGNGALCLRCGGPATGTIERTFKHAPRVAKTLPAKWKALQSCVLHLPMCEHCQSHWLRYNTILIVIVFLMLACWVVLSLIVFRVWGSILDIRNQTGFSVWMIGLVAIAVVIISATAWMVRAPIRAREITRSSITLTGVADSIPGAQPQLAWWARTTRERRLAALAAKNGPPGWVLGGVLVVMGALFFFLGQIPVQRGPPLTGTAARVIAGILMALGAVIFAVSWVRRRKKPGQKNVAPNPSPQNPA
jgi:hypothetical protein